MFGRRTIPSVLILANSHSSRSDAELLVHSLGYQPSIPNDDETGTMAIIRLRPATALVEVGRKELSRPGFIELARALDTSLVLFGDDQARVRAIANELDLPVVSVQETTPVRRFVLVVDDDPDARFIYQLALEHEGYTVLVAHDGAEAVRLAKLHEPDIILMDVMMPVVDGVTAVKTIRSAVTTRDIPVIAVTAMTAGEDLKWVRTSGFDEVILKPTAPADIVAAVVRWTSKPPAPLIPPSRAAEEVR